MNENERRPPQTTQPNEPGCNELLQGLLLFSEAVAGALETGIHYANGNKN